LFALRSFCTSRHPLARFTRYRWSISTRTFALLGRYPSWVSRTGPMYVCTASSPVACSLSKQHALYPGQVSLKRHPILPRGHSQPSRGREGRQPHSLGTQANSSTSHSELQLLLMGEDGCYE